MIHLVRSLAAESAVLADIIDIVMTVLSTPRMLVCLFAYHKRFIGKRLCILIRNLMEMLELWTTTQKYTETSIVLWWLRGSLHMHNRGLIFFTVSNGKWKVSIICTIQVNRFVIGCKGRGGCKKTIVNKRSTSRDYLTQKIEKIMFLYHFRH